MIVKILEVWFLSSVPIGIAVGKLLERSSAPVATGRLQLVRPVVSVERLARLPARPPHLSIFAGFGRRSLANLELAIAREHDEECCERHHASSLAPIADSSSASRRHTVRSGRA